MNPKPGKVLPTPKPFNNPNPNEDEDEEEENARSAPSRGYIFADKLALACNKQTSGSPVSGPSRGIVDCGGRS